MNSGWDFSAGFEVPAADATALIGVRFGLRTPPARHVFAVRAPELAFRPDPFVLGWAPV